MKNAMSLKAKIKNLAKEKGLPAQVILQNYMFERLLVRLSKTEYKDKFVLKGGMLVTALVGLANRATMDLDTTLKGLPLTPEAIRDALEKICAVPADDEIAFEIGAITPIREDDIYGGYRVALTGYFETIITSLKIDVSTGDVITPNAVQYCFSEIFDEDRNYELWVYNIETILAEKVETILRRSVFNTRSKDFYDVYILSTTKNYDPDLFRQALKETAAHRNTTAQIADVDGILQILAKSPELKKMWENYRKQFGYANKIEFNTIITSLTELASILQKPSGGRLSENRREQ